MIKRLTDWTEKEIYNAIAKGYAERDTEQNLTDPQLREVVKVVMDYKIAKKLHNLTIWLIILTIVLILLAFFQALPIFYKLFVYIFNM